MNLFLSSAWLDFQMIPELFDTQAILYIAVSLVVIFVAKWTNDLASSYKLNEQLTEKDNKAIGLAFAGYLLGVSIILWSVLTTDSTSDFLWADIGSTLIWSLLLPRFNNTKELVEDRNVGTGAVIACTHIGTALMIRAAMSGDEDVSIGMTYALTCGYFVIGQLAFAAFGWIYQKTIGFDVHDEIEKDNAAAGVSFGLTLIAISILLSGYITRHDSIPGLLVWFIISVILLVACRIMVDKLILTKASLDDEIAKDRNWGVALIEGASVIGLALIIVGSFN
ncbi:MAG: DUF350 domain-containing protein [Verrucomicrobiales bacterium]